MNVFYPNLGREHIVFFKVSFFLNLHNLTNDSKSSSDLNFRGKITLFILLNRFLRDWVF